MIGCNLPTQVIGRDGLAVAEIAFEQAFGEVHSDSRWPHVVEHLRRDVVALADDAFQPRLGRPDQRGSAEAGSPR